MGPGNGKGKKNSITTKFPKSSRQQQTDGHWLVSIPVLCAVLLTKSEKEHFIEAFCEKPTQQIFRKATHG